MCTPTDGGAHQMRRWVHRAPTGVVVELREDLPCAVVGDDVAGPVRLGTR